MFKYDESVMNWKRPSVNSMEPVTIQLDPLHMVVTVRTQEYKSKFVTSVDIEMMSDIRSRPYSDESEEVIVAEADIPRFFCIAYYEEERDMINVSFMSFVAASADVAEAWRTGLKYLVGKNSYNKPIAISTHDSLRRLYSRVSVGYDDEQAIPLKRIAEAFGKDNTKFVLDELKTMGFTGPVPVSSFTLDMFMKLESELVKRPELDEIHRSLGHNDSGLDMKELRTFLINDQRDPRLNEILDPEPTIQDCLNLLGKYDPTGLQVSYLSANGFRNYMTSVDNDILIPSNRSIYQEMNHPLGHYFINSSHNSYLTGSQLQSKSTVEIYRQQLLLGCRCIEIDCWDGPDGDIDVTHGHTLCTKISFKKVVEAIRDFGFVNSPYPIIVSVENHCGPSQMSRMANYLKTILGELLCSDYLEGDGPQFLPTVLPSPEKLHCKVLIKNKKLSDKGPMEVAPTEIVIGEEVIQEDEEELRHRQERSGAVIKELSDLVNYTIPLHFVGFEAARQKNNCYNMSSFAEKKAAKYAAGVPLDFIEYNKLQLSRIYPNGSRVASSNFNPQLFWNVGCQLVTLNYQTNTLPMQINTGKFLQNGNCGYVLKPESLRKTLTSGSKPFDVFTENPIDDTVAITLRLSIISAQHLGKRDMAPVVEVQLFGIPADTSKPWKTKPCRSKGFEFRWTSDNVVEFKQMILPEMALLHINVLDQTDRRDIGYVVLPVSSIRPGFRYIPLKGATPLSTLFVKVDIAVYVPDEHADFMARLQNPTKYTSIMARHMDQMKNLIEAEEDTVPDAPRSIASGISLDKLMVPTIDTPGSAGPGMFRPSFQASTGGSNKDLLAKNVSITEAFNRNVSSALNSAHHFEKTTYYRPTFCHHCTKLLVGIYKQGEQCLDCKINLHSTCVQHAPAHCHVQEVQVEGKHVTALKASHSKEEKKLLANHEKAVEKLWAPVEKSMKDIIKTGLANLKILKKKKNVTDDEVLAFRQGVFEQLIDAEIGFMAKYCVLAAEYSEERHKHSTDAQADLAKVASAELSVDHEIAVLRIDSTLDGKLKEAMKDVKKTGAVDASGKSVKISKSDLERTKDEQARKLRESANTYRKELLATQREELVSLERKMAVQAEQLVEGRKAELEEQTKESDRVRAKLELIKSQGIVGPDAIPWDKDSEKAYIAALKTDGRLPFQ